MTKMLFDAVETAGARITNDGYLVAEARVARTGIQLYSAGELGLDGEPDRVVRVYRPPEEVFAKDAMASYAHRPVTVDHPTEMVDAANWKRYARGQTGDEVMRDGEFVRVPMMLMDTQAIQDWKDGRRELSMGYTMELAVGDGTTPGGEQYDAVQTKLRMNHLALVSRARGGSELRLGDVKPEESNMPDPKLTTVTVDGLSVETTDAGAQAISKLQKDLADARKAFEDATDSHKEALAAKDKALATKDAELDALKGKVLSDADLDQRVKDRADLIATAKQIADKDYTGLSDADIRKVAVAAKLGDAALKDKSPEYIAARFDILAEDATEDRVHQHLKGKDGAPQPKTTVDSAFSGYVDHLSNAWKGNVQGGA